MGQASQGSDERRSSACQQWVCTAGTQWPSPFTGTSWMCIDSCWADWTAFPAFPLAVWLILAHPWTFAQRHIFRHCGETTMSYRSQLCPSASSSTPRTPCSRSRSAPDVWKEQAAFTAMSAIRKRMFCAECVTSAIAKAGNALCEEGALRLFHLQGFKMTQGRACQFSEGSKTNCDLIGSLLAQEKTINNNVKKQAWGKHEKG